METFSCPKCGRTGVEKHPTERFCVDCVKAERSRLARAYSNNENWQDVAIEAGLNFWDRQPKETNWEYLIWETYMGMYPFKKPTYQDVAEKLETTVGVVKRVAKRWDFTVRLQHYMQYCDAQLRQERLNAMVEMNREYVDAASVLRSKMRLAVDAIDPMDLAAKPKDLVAVAKLADDMERKGRIDTETRMSELAELNGGGDGTGQKKRLTKKDDLGEVIKILMDSGALGSITQIGVKETRETVLVDSEGNTVAMQQGGDEE